MFRRLILTFIFASVIAPLATAEELTKAKTNDIKRLIEITGSTNMAKQFAAATSRQMFQILPSVINESMMLGQQWGQWLGPEIGQRIQAALKREGLLPKGK